MALITLTDLQTAALKKLQALVKNISFKNESAQKIAVPIGHMFFRDWSLYPAYLMYQIRNFDQQPFTNQVNNIGLANPIIQITIVADEISKTYTLFDALRAGLNNFYGVLDATTPRIVVAYSDLSLLNEDYDDQNKRYLLVVDWSLTLHNS